MTAQDALRDKIARALSEATDNGADRTEDYADAVLAVLDVDQLRAEAQVKALRDAVNGLTVIATGKINPRDLMDEAARIAREAGIEQEDEG